MLVLLGEFAVFSSLHELNLKNLFTRVHAKLDYILMYDNEYSQFHLIYDETYLIWIQYLKNKK